MNDILAPRYAMSIALGYAPSYVARYVIPAMKTVEEVRRERLTMLREELGSLVAINDRIGLDRRDSTLSQILNQAPNSKTGKPKEMGSPMARKLEAACGKEVGWMDTDPALEAMAMLTSEAVQIAREFDLQPTGRREKLLQAWHAIAGIDALPTPPTVSGPMSATVSKARKSA